MAFTRKKMTEHTPKNDRPSDVDWDKVAPPMVHVDHGLSPSGGARSAPRLSMVSDAGASTIPTGDIGGAITAGSVPGGPTVSPGADTPRMVHVDHKHPSGEAFQETPHLSVVSGTVSGPKITREEMGGSRSVASPGAPPASEETGSPVMVHVDHEPGSPVMVHVDHESPGSSWRNQVLDIPVSQVTPNPRQPRTYFDEDDLADLAASISSTGVLQPVVVRAAGPELWELIMGERRLRASILAGRETIPAIVRDVPDDQLLKEAIIENIQRSALNPLEEALALQALLDDWGVSQEEVGKAVGKSRISVSHTLGILRLPDDVQRRVASGVISKGHTKILMGIEDLDVVQALADRVVAETMSVRGLEEAVLLLDLQDQKIPRRGRSKRRRVTYPEAVAGFEAKLDTRVRIEGSSKRGRIIIDFSDGEDLRRICEILAIQPRE